MKDLLFNAAGYARLEASGWYYDEDRECYCAVSNEKKEGKTFTRAQECCSRFLKASESVRSSFLTLGKELWTIRIDKLYRYVAVPGSVYGYRSFYKFVADVFGMGKTTAANLMAVWERFGSGNDSSLYEAYSYSQLLEMKDMKDEVKKLNSGVSVRNIRLLKDFYKTHGVDSSTTLEADLLEARQAKKKENALDAVRRANMEFIPGDDKPGALTEGEVEGYEEDDPSESEEEIVPTSERFDEIDASEEPEKQESTLENGVDPSFVKTLAISMIKRKLTELETFFPSVIPFAREMVGALEDGSAFREFSAKTILAKASGQTERYHIDLVNDKARLEWLDKYTEWGVWIDVPEIGVKLYRYDFCNGDALIVTAYFTYWSFSPDKCSAEVRYCILSKERPHYDLSGISRTQVKDYLSRHRDSI